MEDLRSSPAPEAIAYFELLGNEIGYMKTSEFRDTLSTLLMYYHVYFRILPASVSYYSYPYLPVLIAQKCMFSFSYSRLYSSNQDIC